MNYKNNLRRSLVVFPILRRFICERFLGGDDGLDEADVDDLGFRVELL